MKSVFFIVCLFSVFAASAQRISKEEYIEKYAPLAIDDMAKYGIPASIKMAQGLLESDSGNSRLAVIGNNHFGIKCKSDWRGETIAHDDDALQECFRQYASARESWDDHAQFLKNSERYAALFKLEPTDYKAWARGLKQAGYATNPKYPDLLIKIIEDNELWRLDSGNLIARNVPEQEVSAQSVEPAGPVGESNQASEPARQRPLVTAKGGVDPDNFTIQLP